MADSTVDWPGKSGQKYRYWFADSMAPTNFQSVGGNYMYVKRLPNGNYLPLYIGETQNLSDRHSDHERLADAKRAGATHLMAHTTPAGEKARKDEEKDLIAYWNPVLNIQHKKAS
jgi:hypothetical protein